MIRSKLLKGLALGLCMSVLYTGVAFAQSEGVASQGFVGQEISAEDSALYDKQSEIDQYVFVDHAKEIEKKGFSIVYTGVADSKVEIGITPFSEENADYLYDIFGKDAVKVVASEAAVLYATVDPAADNAAGQVKTDPANDDIYTTMELAPDASVTNTDVAAPAEGGEDEFSIQIESVEDGNLEDPSVIYQSGVADTAEEGTDVRTIAATDDAAIAEGNVVSDAVDKADGLSTPVIILIIAGGAVLIGGTVIYASKKKSAK
jgi:hypothetical protein